jgi:hypothetical protein
MIKDSFKLRDKMNPNNKFSEYVNNGDQKHKYMLLGRWQMDCDYFLGNGQRCEKHLFFENSKEQIEAMKMMHRSFAEDATPEWLTWEQIENYEKQMIPTFDN